MKSKHIAYIVLFCFICLSIILLIWGVLNIPIIDLGEPTLENELKIWNAELPTDTEDLLYFYDESTVELQFRSSFEEALRFAEQVCGAPLIQGYDPFNAVNSAFPEEGSVLIKTENFLYYSRSPYTDDVMGNRCDPTFGGSRQVVQIAVHKQMDGDGFLQLMQPIGSCEKDFIPSCYLLGMNYVNPIKNFPFMVIGLAFDGDNLVLSHDEICMDTLYMYPDIRAWQSDWGYWVGAEVIISIDDNPLETGVITQQGRLIPKELADSNIKIIRNHYWHYCIHQTWIQGYHSVKVEMLASNEVTESIDFKFLVRD